MKWILLLVFLALPACSYLNIQKDCAKVEPNDSVGDNKFVCREVMPWN